MIRIFRNYVVICFSYCSVIEITKHWCHLWSSQSEADNTDNERKCISVLSSL